MAEFSNRHYRLIVIERWESGKSKAEIIEELEQLGQNKIDAERTFYQVTAPSEIPKSDAYQRTNSLILVIIIIIGVVTLFAFLASSSTQSSGRGLGSLLFAGIATGIGLIKYSQKTD